MTNPTAPLKVVPDKHSQHSEFIELAAHDLQAPLRKLSVLTERLTAKYSSTISGSEVQGYISRIHSCISDMQSLIDGFSSPSSITPDTMNYLPCDIGMMIQKIIRDIDPLIQEKQVSISVSDMPVIQGDQTQLEMLLKKVLENAILFSRENTSPQITISCQPMSLVEKENYNLHTGIEYHRICIEDNGIGFDQAYAEKIFWPLVRLNGKASYPGNGIGLALCEKIVANHQGILYAEGIENKGAKFTIILPEKI